MNADSVYLEPVDTDVMVKDGERSWTMRTWVAVFTGDKARLMARGYGSSQEAAVANLYNDHAIRVEEAAYNSR